MKKLFILPAAVLACTIAVNAQDITAIKKNEKGLAKEEKNIKKEKREDRKTLRKLEGKEVSNAAKQQFSLDFGYVPGVSWKRETHFDVATFSQNDIVQSAFYGADARLVGTTTKKLFTDLPVKAREYVNKNYPGFTRVAVVLFDDNENNESDMILYGQQFADADSYFIELMKDGKKVVLESDMHGNVSHFITL